MQGQLRGESLSVIVTTECEHSGRRFTIEMDANLNDRKVSGPTNPLVFAPFVDFDTLADPSIIDAF